MSQSLIYTAFNGSQSLQPSNVLPLGSTIRRYGKNLSQSGDGVLVSGCGYYVIDGLVGLTSTTAGDVEISLTQDGNPIQGGSEKVTVGATGSYIVPVHAVIRMKCCSEPTTIQMVLGTTTAQIDSTSLIISKA